MSSHHVARIIPFLYHIPLWRTDGHYEFVKIFTNLGGLMWAIHIHNDVRIGSWIRLFGILPMATFSANQMTTGISLITILARKRDTTNCTFPTMTYSQIVFLVLLVVCSKTFVINICIVNFFRDVSGVCSCPRDVGGVRTPMCGKLFIGCGYTNI